jgi:hypothetical protein
MTTLDSTIEKIRQLPEPLLAEVNDFIDFLMTKPDGRRIQANELDIAEAGMSDYLLNLQDYEERLASGAIQW